MEGKNKLIIAMIGPVGGGKSTFINLLLGTETAAVSDGLDPCTTNLNHYEMEGGHLHPALHEHRLVLLDTPGFHNTYQEDTKMLRKVGAWLSDSRRLKAKVLAIVYVFPIYAGKMNYHECSNLKLVEEILGADSFFRLFLITTGWDGCPTEIGDAREATLKRSHWKLLLDGGATMERFTEDTSSAQAILSTILTKFAADKTGRYSEKLQIQRKGHDRDRFLATLLSRRERNRYCSEKHTIVILLGETGVGKSTFINDLAEGEMAAVNHTLTPNTSVHYYRIPVDIQGSEPIGLTFVDCPGYNGINKDAQVSRTIYDFLKSPINFSPESEVLGVVYLLD
ncbi:hypothetical protein FA15DRAFT_756283, partial [Coprinopsis marcescibilis]